MKDDCDNKSLVAEDLTSGSHERHTKDGTSDKQISLYNSLSNDGV